MLFVSRVNIMISTLPVVGGMNPMRGFVKRSEKVMTARQETALTLWMEINYINLYQKKNKS
jgi:hypothetical protein